MTDASPRSHSRYGILAVVVLSADFVWYFLAVLSAPYGATEKSARIFLAAWLLGLSAVIAAYKQKRCSQALAHVGALLLVIDLSLTCLLPTF